MTPRTPTTSTVDLRRQWSTCYSALRKPLVVQVPPLTCLMIDGAGHPDKSAEYSEAVQALFTLSWTIRSLARVRKLLDYQVMPLEGLWWAAGTADFASAAPADWRWTSLIVQPDVLDEPLLAEAMQIAAGKRDLPALDRVRLDRWTEGTCAQVLHVGPYDAEGPTIIRLHAFIAQMGLLRRGKHHEIYLGDPRRAAPDKLRTILRQPVGRP